MPRDIDLTWDKNTETDLDGYTLSIAGSGDPAAVILSIDIAKDASGYELKVSDHTVLNANGSYEFALIARDTNGNLSEKSIAIEKAAAKADNTVAAGPSADEGGVPTVWYVAAGAATLAIAGGGIYWFKLRKKIKVI